MTNERPLFPSTIALQIIRNPPPEMSGTEKTHFLKTWPEPFEHVQKGLKLYEVRVNDRNFQNGDWIWLCEFDPSPDKGYTGRMIQRRIICMTTGYGLPAEVVVLGLDPEYERSLYIRIEDTNFVRNESRYNLGDYILELDLKNNL